MNNLLFGSLALLTIIKIGILILLFLYIIFAFVVLNQIRIMHRIIHEDYSSVTVFFLGLLHLAFAVSLFLLALAIL